MDKKFTDPSFEGEPEPKWPNEAYNSRQFMNSGPARLLRIQCELIEPSYRLQNMGVHNTLVFFGSARPVDSKRAKIKYEEKKAELEKSDLPQSVRDEQLLEAEKHLRLARYYDDAVQLSENLTRWSLSIKYPHKRFFVCSGGGPGMMEAANRGAHQAGGQSIGLGITLPFEQGVNGYVTDELAFEFHYFFIRKYWFLYLAKAMIVFPGGFGTMDEFFEIITLIQTKKISKNMPVVLYGSAFWNDILNFENFYNWGTISKSDLSLFKIMDNVDEVTNYITEELTKHYLS